MKGKNYIQKAEQHLNEMRAHYYFLKERKQNAEHSRLMYLAAEDAIRAAGFTVKHGDHGYIISCKWDDAPEGTKR